MKRIIILMLACVMAFASVTTSSATEFKISGTLDMAFEWLDNPYPNAPEKGATNGDFFTAIQRLRTQIDIIANESLKGVAYFEVGTIRWGQNRGPEVLNEDGSGTDDYLDNVGQSTGGAIGADGVNIETKRLFLDYQLPHTELQLRMGIQGIALPGLANNNPVLDDDVAAVLANYQFTDQFNVVLAWARALDTEIYSDTGNNNTSSNKYDVFTIIGGLNFEEVTIVPYITYAAIGKNADINSNGDILGGASPSADRDVWWLGLSAKSNNLGNLNLAMDFVWGWTDDNGVTSTTLTGPTTRDQSGFYVLLHGDYKLEYFTPTLDLWYSSGDDSGSSGELMPVISPGGLALTNLGTDGGFFDTTDNAFTLSGVGTFGVVLGLTEVSFIEKVTHDFKIAYMQGTTSDDFVGGEDVYSGFPTDEDRAWEFNIDTNWQMYENLAAIVELGYLNPDYSSVEDEKAVWKAAIGFQYTY